MEQKLLFTAHHPEGLEIQCFKRVDSGQWIDYFKGEGTLSDGRPFVITASCSSKGWYHKVAIEAIEGSDEEGEDYLLNPKNVFGRLSRH